ETYLPQHCPTVECDLLLANILAGPLMELMPRFVELTRPDTQLVLSGILDVQAETVSQHYQTEFKMDNAVVLEEWVRLSGVRHG
ncbi:50S ribosomal protein L11 methyltransferase, partial [Methylophaga sp. UBA3593]